jgi:type VI secretion system protein VasG
MAGVAPKSLAGKLNALCRRALEGAAGLCLSRSNYHVEIEHWLVKLLESSQSDFVRLLRHYDIDSSRVQRELTRALDGLKTGNTRAPDLSPDVLDLMREAWVLGSLEHGAARIRSGHLLLALLTERSLSARLHESSPELARIPGPTLQQELAARIAGSAEDEMAAPAEGAPAGPRPGTRTPGLDQYTTDLTERAAKGAIDPVIGRDAEIRKIMDILQRRRQNNPILTGEAGVGKTAVVEGFALRVAADDVPPSLRGVRVRVLDLGLLQAGAGVKGEFENRLKQVIAEVKASTQPIILFIDEAHTIIGAGGAPGQGDAANLLKPALARGELRTIAATTWAEYKKYFETDLALKRRFQPIKVDEPSEPAAVRMLRGVAETLEKHHKVRLLDEALDDAVRLSNRYLTDRQLPDKAVSVLDTACARVALSQTAVPPALEDCAREIELVETEIRILTREQAAGADHRTRLDELAARKDQAQSRRKALEEQRAAEQKLVEQIQTLRTALEEGKRPADQADRDAAELRRLREELARLQGETPLILPVVDRQAVAEVVAAWTGIPVGRMVVDEIRAVLGLRQRLQKRIIGQDAALEAISRRIQTARANLVDPRRPIGVFLLLGPSGVGKTETALALGEALYGSDASVITVNMSEYKETHKVSRLVGSAPGYVGYGEGGVLTEAIRRRPYSVLLLDEVEKAHEDVQELFYQVFDKGTLQDDRQNVINFKNTIILLTSNVGTDLITKLCADPETAPTAEALAEALRPELLKHFKPALLGRLNVVPYLPLGDATLQAIIRLQLSRITERLRLNHKAALRTDEALIQAIAARCKEVEETGARNVDHILTGSMLPEISCALLDLMAAGKPAAEVVVEATADGKWSCKVNGQGARAGTD